MLDLIQQSISHTISCFETEVADSWSWPSAEAGLAVHAYYSMDLEIPFEIDAILTKKLGHRKSEAPVLAAYGYCIYDGLITEPDVLDEWKAGLERISKKQVLVESRSTFVYRPHELLGITLGLMKLSAECKDELEWLKGNISKIERVYQEYPVWGKVIGSLASSFLSSSWQVDLSLNTESQDLTAAAAYCWIIQAHPDYATALNIYSKQEQVERELLRLCTTTSSSKKVKDVGEIAIVSVALRDTTSRIVQSAIDSHYDISLDLHRQSRKEKADLLLNRSAYVIERSKRKGRRWRWIARIILSPLYIATAAVPLVVIYRYFDDMKFIQDYGVYAVIVLLLLLVYRLVADWEKSPVKKLSDKLGLLIAQRAEKRWHGEFFEEVNSLDREGLKK